MGPSVIRARLARPVGAWPKGGAPRRVVDVVATRSEQHGLVRPGGRVPVGRADRPGRDEFEGALLGEDTVRACRRRETGIARRHHGVQDDMGTLICVECLPREGDDYPLAGGRCGRDARNGGYHRRANDGEKSHMAARLVAGAIHSTSYYEVISRLLGLPGRTLPTPDHRLFLVASNLGEGHCGNRQLAADAIDGDPYGGSFVDHQMQRKRAGRWVEAPRWRSEPLQSRRAAIDAEPEAVHRAPVAGLVLGPHAGIPDAVGRSRKRHGGSGTCGARG